MLLGNVSLGVQMLSEGGDGSNRGNGRYHLFGMLGNRGLDGGGLHGVLDVLVRLLVRLCLLVMMLLRGVLVRLVCLMCLVRGLSQRVGFVVCSGLSRLSELDHLLLGGGTHCLCAQLDASLTLHLDDLHVGSEAFSPSEAEVGALRVILFGELK